VRRAWRRGAVALALAAATLVSTPAAVVPTQADATRPPFSDWLAGVRAEAIGRGLRTEVVDAALAGLELQEQVRDRDRTQAEFVVPFEPYLDRWLNPSFVRLGLRRARPHRRTLAKVGAAYGVPPAVLLGVWGVESNYGRFSGVRPVVAALATLAYDNRRGAFFRGQLFDALTILDRGDVELSSLCGSWAGAMGQPQFLPSSYLKYAVDFDADGRRDIWNTPADVFASIANYLASHGWEKGSLWGREVRLPKAPPAGAAAPPPGRPTQVGDVPLRGEGCRAEREMTVALPLREWRRLGVRLRDGRALPARDTTASLVRAGDRAFLVYRNYEAVLQYNCAHHYALGVLLLSDRLR
jgi:membrane-bound lytic murein transglycosylase B